MIIKKQYMNTLRQKIWLNKLFLDTNIIIDFVQERKNELDAIKELFIR